MAKTKFYISYRRTDDFETTQKIHSTLAEAFGRNNVFFWAGTPEITDHFDALKYIKKNIHQSDVMLVVIGREWVAIGRERFNNPNDYVLFELEKALSDPRIKVVPLLINNAKMPRTDDLPPSIQKLTNIQALSLSEHNIEALPQMLIRAGMVKKRNRQLGIIVATLVTLLSMFIGVVSALNNAGDIDNRITPTGDVANVGTDTETATRTSTATLEELETGTSTSTATRTIELSTETSTATQFHQTYTVGPSITKTPTLDVASVVETLDAAATSTAIDLKTQTAEMAYTTTAAVWTATPSPTSSDEPITATFFPQEVSLVIINHGGVAIGEGTFRIYSTSNKISLSETVRIDLEVRFDSYYITPTPAGGITKVPVRTPAGGNPTSTREPATVTPTPFYVSDPEQPFYQAMGATLNCSPNSFTGCGEQDDVPIDFEGHTWSWILKPVDGAVGVQDLLAEVWIPQSVNGQERLRVIWDHDFQLRIIGSDDDSGLPVEIIVALIGFLGVILAAGIPVILRKRDKDNAINHQVSSIKIFVNYRRDDSSAWATHIASKLINEFGENAVFRDIHGIKYGDDFEVRINEAVWSCDVLIAVIGKQWLTLTEEDNTGKTIRRLDNPKDFVRLEIVAAQKRKIRVIPALVDDAEMPSEKDLPNNLKPLAKYNAINIRNDSSDDDINRLIRQLKTK